jgi:hypothetical protein
LFAILAEVRQNLKKHAWHFACCLRRQPRSSRDLREGTQPSSNPACASGEAVERQPPTCRPSFPQASTSCDCPKRKAQYLVFTLLDKADPTRIIDGLARTAIACENIPALSGVCGYSSRRNSNNQQVRRSLPRGGTAIL